MSINETLIIEKLFMDYSKKIYYIVKKIVINEDTAKDIVQDTFVTAFEKLSQLKDSKAVEKWLIQIAVNKAKRKYSYSQKEMPSDEAYLFENSIENQYLPEKQLENQELKQQFKAHFNDMASEFKQVLILYCYGEFSYKEIAETLEITEGTVKSRLHRAKRILKDKITSGVLQEGGV